MNRVGKFILALILILILTDGSAASAADWSFTINGDPSLTEVVDASMLSSLPDNNYGSGSSLYLGFNYADYSFWIAFSNLDDSMSSGNGGAGYSGPVDSFLIGLPISSTQQAASDSLKVIARACRRLPVESQITWNSCQSEGYWTSGGGSDTLSDVFPETGDTAILCCGVTDTLRIYPEVSHLTEEDWIISYVWKNDANSNYALLCSSEHPNEKPYLKVWGHDEDTGALSRRARVIRGMN